MGKQFSTTLVSNTVHIDTTQIPNYVAINVGQIALRAIQRDYKDLAIYADYQRWKQEREAVKDSEFEGRD